MKIHDNTYELLTTQLYFEGDPNLIFLQKKSLILDDSTIPGSITEVNVSDKFAKLDKSYHLPISIVSGSMDKIEFRVNLQIDHAGISTGHATQVISYTATCQK